MAPHEELYNLGTDKGEKKNLNLKHSKIKTRLKKKLTKWVVEHSKDALSPGNIKNMSREDIAKIATLGYITSTVDTGKKRNLPDPKIKIDIYNEYLKTSRMMQEKKYDEVIEILKSIIKSNPDIVDVRLRLAINYSKKTMYREAVDIYLDILKQRPDCNEAMINLINALVDLGEFDSALEEVDKFIKMFPNDPILYGKKGLLYYYKKDYDNALKFFKKSVDIEGTNPQSLDKIGEIYIIKEEYETAESYIHRAISINPKLKSAHYHLGQLEDARKNPGKANRYYRKELDIDPENFKAAYNLAGNLKRMGHIEEAVKFYRQTIKHNPGFKMAYFMIAQYFLEKGENQKEAIELCKKGLTIMPKDRETMFGYYILTNIYGGIGDKANFDYYTREGNRLFESLNKNADK